MPRSILRSILLVLLLLPTFGGCVPRAFSGSRSVEGEWELQTAVTPDAALVPTAKGSSRIRFEDGTVTGDTGCDRFSGSYAVAGQIVTFSRLATAANDCLPAARPLGQAVLSALGARAARTEFDGRTMRLISGSTTLVYRRA